MKFDPYSWNEVQPNEKIEVGQGVLRVRCSAPSPLYIAAQGVEALAGVDTIHEAEVSETVTFHVAAAKGVRVFWMPPATAETVAQADPQGFTNVDRMPHESGMMAEVTKARRQLELERRAMLRDIRVEAAAARASIRDAAPKAAPAPVTEDVPPVIEDEPQGAPA